MDKLLVSGEGDGTSIDVVAVSSPDAMGTPISATLAGNGQALKPMISSCQSLPSSSSPQGTDESRNLELAVLEAAALGQLSLLIRDIPS